MNNISAETNALISFYRRRLHFIHLVASETRVTHPSAGCERVHGHGGESGSDSGAALNCAHSK